jgi:LysR family hydrogen peroxide-inducible transcriptional activator
MNLRDLEYVVAIAETGHFGLAAERCRTSQPTLSMQVKKLETELGAALFERSPRGTLTTTIGAEIVARARSILDDVRQMRDTAARGAGGFGGVLRLGIIPTAGPYLLPRILPAMRQAYPRLQLHLREAMTARLLALLHENELDAAIVSEPIDDQALVRVPLIAERFVLALTPQHPMAGTARLRPETLAGEPVLMLEEGHCLRDQTTLVCRRFGLRPMPEIQASSVETMRQMVALGLGLAILPELATIGPFASAGIVVRPLEASAARRLLTLVWRRTYPRAEQLEALAVLVRRSLEPAPAPAPATGKGDG